MATEDWFVEKGTIDYNKIHRDIKTNKIKGIVETESNKMGYFTFTNGKVAGSEEYEWCECFKNDDGSCYFSTKLGYNHKLLRKIEQKYNVKLVDGNGGDLSIWLDDIKHEEKYQRPQVFVPKLEFKQGNFNPKLMNPFDSKPMDFFKKVRQIDISPERTRPQDYITSRRRTRK